MNKIQIYGRNIRSKRNDFKELENFIQKISNMRVLYLKSKKPNKIVEKQILTDSMLRIIEQTRKENLYYGKQKLQEMLLTKGYVLKLTIIGN